MPTALSTIQDKSVYISNRFEIEFNPVFSFLAFCGIFLLWRIGLKKELLFLLLLLLTTVTANIFYLQVSPIEYWHLDDHLITVNWITAFLASTGIYLLLTWAHTLNWLKYALPLLLLVLPTLTFQKNISADDQTKEFLYWGYGVEALKSMDQNSRYFAESDYDYFSILYLQQEEHKRPDVSLKITPFVTQNDWNNLVREISSGPSTTSQPIYCAFPNGDFINGFLQHAKTASFRPEGTIVEFTPPKSLHSLETIQPLEEFWEKYLAPLPQSLNQVDRPGFMFEVNANPINGLLLELCAHPYLNMANYLKIQHNLDHWVVFYLNALTLIQEPKWRAETWADMAEGDLTLKNTPSAVRDFLLSAEEYRQAGMLSESNEMDQKALKIDPTLVFELQNVD